MSQTADEEEEEKIRDFIPYFLRIKDKTSTARLHIPDPTDTDAPLHERLRETTPGGHISDKKLKARKTYIRKTLAQYPPGWEKICGHCCYVWREAEDRLPEGVEFRRYLEMYDPTDDCELDGCDDARALGGEYCCLEHEMEAKNAPEA